MEWDGHDTATPPRRVRTCLHLMELPPQVRETLTLCPAYLGIKACLHLIVPG